MSIEEAIARDLVAILFVTFTFGGLVLFLIVSSVADTWRRAAADRRAAALKQSMIELGYRPDEIVRVIHAGRDSST